MSVCKGGGGILHICVDLDYWLYLKTDIPELLVKNGELEVWNLEAIPPKQKLGACNHKTQHLSEITFTVRRRIKPVINIYANETPPPTGPAPPLI